MKFSQMIGCLALLSAIAAPAQAARHSYDEPFRSVLSTLGAISKRSKILGTTPGGDNCGLRVFDLSKQMPLGYSISDDDWLYQIVFFFGETDGKRNFTDTLVMDQDELVSSTMGTFLEELSDGRKMLTHRFVKRDEFTSTNYEVTVTLARDGCPESMTFDRKGFTGLFVPKKTCNFQN